MYNLGSDFDYTHCLSELWLVNVDLVLWRACGIRVRNILSKKSKFRFIVYYITAILVDVFWGYKYK